MADTDELLVVLSFLALGLLLLLLAGGAMLAKASRRRKPVASAKPRPVRSAGATRRLPVRRRVISLHATTPGQSPHEYNIGDNQGTRGSALVRAA